jgi:hypothetical protein
MGVFDRMIDAFGLADCEAELEEMKDRYVDIFFDETPFNQPAISPTAYLIVGRRGSGKTALAQFFSFQRQIPGARCLDVDEPLVYHEVLSHLSARAPAPRQLAIPHLAKIWEFVVWALIFQQLSTESNKIAATLQEKVGARKLTMSWLFSRLQQIIVPDNRPATEENLSQLLEDEQFEAAKKAVLKICSDRPMIIAIDTLEQYDVSDDGMMNAVASLVEFASRFHVRYSGQGVHIKVFIAGEVFPYLKEGVLLNPLKSIKHPVYLLWRPKDLLRLICWRLFKRLQSGGLLAPESRDIHNWENHREIYEKMWLPYFGQYIHNLNGHVEETFAYLLRHTQMRPRQLILLCNAIGNRAIDSGHFPRFSEQIIREGIVAEENELANEIINAFESVYPHAGLIVDALMGVESIFPASTLDRRAKETKTHWNYGTYSPHNFRKMMTELGIVGRIKRRNEQSGYIDAEFEYASPSRLPLSIHDQCVIHPMFYRRLNVAVETGTRVLPFSTDQEIRELTTRESMPVRDRSSRGRSR